jgi:hypothetical protein
MTTADERGIKRKCQSEGCGLPFYDLGQDVFDCPNCGESFDTTIPVQEPETAANARYHRKPPEFRIIAP